MSKVAVGSIDERVSKRARLDSPPLPTVARRPLVRVVSGGQTGADQAALRAASKAGLRTGGWIPRGFATSNGPNASLGERFGLKELRTTTSVARAYVARSQANVDLADATVVFRLAPNRGTDRTIGYARTGRWQVVDVGSSSPHRPCLVVRELAVDSRQATVERIVRFIRQHDVRVLNVAGHRETSAPIGGFDAAVECVLDAVFAQIQAQQLRKKKRVND